jgi:Tfp pilus assembly protein PilV
MRLESKGGVANSLLSTIRLQRHERLAPLQIMNLRRSIKPGGKQLSLAFTLAEAMISIVVAAISIAGILYGFVLFGQRAEWSTCSTAAQSMAMRRLEQTRAAKWDPLDYHATNGLGVDEVVPANFPVVITNLDIPLIGTNTVRATNTTTITLISADPPLKLVRVDCVWSVLSRGPFTNTVITYRAPDQ